MDKKYTEVLEVLVPNWKRSGQYQCVPPTAGSRQSKRDRTRGKYPPSPLISEPVGGGWMTIRRLTENSIAELELRNNRPSWGDIVCDRKVEVTLLEI